MKVPRTNSPTQGGATLDNSTSSLEPDEAIPEGIAYVSRTTRFAKKGHASRKASVRKIGGADDAAIYE